MGTRYTTVQVVGFNASPPSDLAVDTSASNKVQWQKHLDKIGAPLKTAIEAINNQLLTFTDFGSRSITTTDTALSSDHLRTIEVAATVTTTFTLSLSDAATMAAGYVVSVRNNSIVPITIGRVTGGNTINGVAGNLILAPNDAVQLKVNAGATGYDTTHPLRVAPTVQVISATGTYTRPPGCIAALVMVKGGGASGGGSSVVGLGGGGGEGESQWRMVTAAQIGASQAVTIGAGGAAILANTNAPGNVGGTSAFGALLTAAGGSGGISGNGGGVGSAGGTGGSGGDWKMPGAAGHTGADVTAATGIAAAGGGQGGGTPSVPAPANSGGGGYGGSTGAASGAGASGVVVVQEWY